MNINGYIMPHPPIVIPQIGRGEENKASTTTEGCNRVADEIAAEKPETIVVITPHGPVFRDAICINQEKNLTGSFSKFNHSEIKYSFKNDDELSNGICKKLKQFKIESVKNNKATATRYNIDTELDHGVLVPIHFILQKYSEFKLVHITYGMIGIPNLYKCGIAIRQSIEELRRKTVVIASSDLSHKLKDESPYKYNPDGVKYDHMVVECISGGKYSEFLASDGKVRNNAGECGHRSITILIGMYEARKTNSEVFSYEGPFGVGYMTAGIRDLEPAKTSVLSDFLELKDSKKANNRVNESDHVKIARKTINEFVKKGKKIKPEKTSANRKGVFVSIKKDGNLRGCIGTISPVMDSVENEIIENAISAATRDPRFNAIEEWELSDLDISVDVLHKPEEIESRDELDVKEYGVIVRKGMRSGLLLPNLEGIDTVDEQISIALRKAGISEDENYRMERFKVERFT